MKLKHLFAALFLLMAVTAFTQSKLPGINYQAVARDEKGQVLANKDISLKITLLTGEMGGKSDYAETHYIHTNELGLFNLALGSGKVLSGDFKKIPWSTMNIWMEIAIDETGGDNFTTISSSQLMAVPYAFHATTADEVKGATDEEKAAGPFWKTNGNDQLFPGLFLGTLDCSDLVIKTNNIERMRIYCDGKFSLAANFDASGIMNFTNTTQSTTKDNGAVIIEGGVGIEKNVNIGGNTEVDGTLGVDGVATFLNTTQSTTKDNGAVVIEGGVGIEKNVNIGGNSGVTGNSTVGGTLGVTGIATFLNTTQSTTKDNGAVIVEGGVGIEKNVNIGGNTEVDGTLGVDGIATFKGTTQSTTKDDGAVVIEGGVGIEKNANIGGNAEVDGTLGVDGVTTLRNNLILTKNDASFLATFQNTNSSGGDGLLIKLGKAKSIYSPPSAPQLSEAQAQRLRNLISCEYTGSKTDLLGDIVAEGLLDDLKMIAGLAIGTGNLIVNYINDQLDLPLDIGASINSGIGLPLNVTEPINDGLDLPWQIGFLSLLDDACDPCVDDDDLPGAQTTVMPELPSVTIPGIPAGALKIPAIPVIDLVDFGVVSIDLSLPSFWGIPDFCLSDTPGSTPLDNENEFIRFTDVNNVKVGTIRAVSVTNWSTNYLNPIFMYTLYSAFTSSKVDKLHALYHFQVEIGKAITDYTKLGVEYSSGNGDYAEWLERMEVKESIVPGDIIGVVGGKISKNLAHAEQVMVVSHNPIVLGNVPAEDRTQLGNNIAFMGQVPVKVMGPVASGDYIIGQRNTPGYGIAKHEAEMTIDDFKYAVGRSWVSDLDRGPKMVNTVVGVHNGDFLKILKRHEAKLQETESRFQSLEAKVDLLMKAGTR